MSDNQLYKWLIKKYGSLPHQKVINNGGKKW